MARQRIINELSYWERQSFFSDYQALIIGSGIVGLHAALTLRERDPAARILVVDRGALPAGASTRNAGFACFGSMTELLADRQVMGEEGVWELVDRRYRGLQRLRSRLGDTAIRFQQKGGYELFQPADEEDYIACLDAMPAFNRQLKAITGLVNTFRIADDELSTFGFKNVKHLLLNQAEGQLDTGRMMRTLLGVARNVGIDIITGLSIESLESDRYGVTVTTAEGWELHFPKVLVAVNGFARRLLPALTVQPARNQVLITQPLAKLPFEGTFHYDQGYCYFRNIDGRVLLGGGRNLAPDREQTDVFGTTSLIREYLLTLLREVILPGQEIAIDSWWSGIMGVGSVKAPIIQEVQPNVVVGVRLGGMGVAIGALVGEEAANLLWER